ncbi:MAG: hypothetical protein EOP85_01815 [Verrucomicrobiaceae bacterium]|nr:MAG: hypothetical protein EOP85_01815 [Verrucomicrobiaceae bacterium]
MKAPLMFTAGVLLGISVGFIVWKGGGQARGSDQAENGKVTARQPSGRQIPRPGSGANELLAEYLKGKSPAEMNADEVYEVIAPQMTEYMMGWTEGSVDRARKIYQLKLLASKLPPDVMVKVMEMGREKGANQYILRQWFGAYVNRYPEQAMAWASRQPNAKEWRGETILRLANTNPELAIKLYDEEILNGASPGAVQNVPYRLAQEYGKQGSAAVFRLLDSLPADSATQVLYRGWDMLPDEEKPAFMAELRKRAFPARRKPNWS